MSFASIALYYDDVEVGQEWESQGRTITETDVVNFAGLSGDFNPIHMDHEFAKTTAFRQPIAHGLLILTVGSGLGVNSPLMRTVAFMQVREWNFRSPVFIGDTLHLRSKVLRKEIKGRGRRGEITWQRTVVNQEGRVVQDGELITLVECRAAPRQQDSSDSSDPAQTAAAS